MKRTLVVIGAATAVVVASGLAGQYSRLTQLAQTPDPQKTSRPAVAAAPNPEGDAGGSTAAVKRFLDGEAAAGDADKLAKLDELISALEAPADSQPLSKDDAQSAAAAVVDALNAGPDSSAEGLELRRRAVGLLAARLGSPAAKAYVLTVLDQGPQDLREEVVSRAGGAQGVHGPAVYAKVLELADKGLVPDSILPEALRRLGGRKARAQLLTLMNSTDSIKLVDGCAVALQDYREPALMGEVLARLEEVGGLERARMPWISASLLSDYLKTADDAGLRRGLLAMAARPALAREEAVRRGLASADSQVQQAARDAERAGVAAKTLDESKLATTTAAVQPAPSTGATPQVAETAHP